MSEVDFPPIEPEVSHRGEENTEVAVEIVKFSMVDDEVARLREENTGLKVENAKLTTNITWLKRVIGILIGICLILLAALVVVFGIKTAENERKSKKGSRTGSLQPLFLLLRKITTKEEVIRILDLHLGQDGRDVLQSLSTSTSADDFFHNVLVALERRELLTGEFFAALIRLAPRRRGEIRKAQKDFIANAKDDDESQ